LVDFYLPTRFDKEPLKKEHWRKFNSSFFLVRSVVGNT